MQLWKMNVLNHRISRFGNQYLKWLETRFGNHWSDQILLPMLEFILQNPYRKPDLLEEAKLYLGFKE